MNSSYDEVYKIRGANDPPAEQYEFQITRDETALFTVGMEVPADLAAFNGSKDGRVHDGTFQEVDIETGDLIFQWQASKHFNLTKEFDAVKPKGGINRAREFFHISSVDKDGLGNYLAAFAFMNCLVYIDGKSGVVLWRLGGKNNTFEDLSDGDATNFNGSHYARFTNDGKSITLFDHNTTTSPAEAYT